MANMFKPIYDEDGVVIGSQPNWKPELGDRQPDKSGRTRFPPPSRFSKSVAENLGEKILGVGLASLPGLHIKCNIFAAGSNQIVCRYCGTKSHYTVEVCPKCSLKINPKQNYHTAIRYNKSGWLVVLGSDVVRAKDVPKGFNLKKPEQVSNKDWYMLVKLCFAVAPIAYCHIKPTMKSDKDSLTPQVKINPETFSVGIFKCNEKLHLKWTRSLVLRYQSLLWINERDWK